MPDDSTMDFAGSVIPRGETRDLRLPISQTYSGTDVGIPFRVVRGREPGPVLLLTAAIHGDELNGIGVIRRLMLDPPFEVQAGTMVLVPVVNIFGLERKTRYLPDRRDLNRNFPGTTGGSMARRIAHAVFQGLVVKSDFIIDFHTAASGRTNFPNVRGDLTNPEVEQLADAFGAGLVLESQGIRGTLRYAATQAGHPTILVEAGEVAKIEPSVVEYGVRGVGNLLVALGMAEGESRPPLYRARVRESTWLRSDFGGLLQFHVAPGDVAIEGQPIATCADLLGKVKGQIIAPQDGVILSLTTMPMVKPGDPVCHLAIPVDGVKPIQKALKKSDDSTLYQQLQDDLGTSIVVNEPESEPPT